MKSYREYLLEQVIGKEEAANLMVPMGGFYLEPRINKLLGLMEAKGGQRFVIPTPVMFDRYDIAYLMQFPPVFWSRALEYRYGDALFEAKRAQLADKEIPRTSRVRFTQSSGKHGYKAYNFEIQTFSEQLLTKLESPFHMDYIHNLMNDSEGKQELLRRIKGSDFESSYPYEDENRYSPEYAVYGYDLTPSGEFRDPQKKGIRTQLGRNYIAPQKKHIGDTTIPNWIKGGASGFLRGNPLFYEKVIGDESSYKLRRVSFSGGKTPEFFVDLLGNPQRRQHGKGGGIKIPVFTHSGMDHLRNLVISVGMEELPFETNPDGLASFVAMNDKGREIESNDTLRTHIPILLEGEMLRQADYKKIFGLNNDNRIERLFQGKEVDLSGELPLMLQMAIIYQKYGEDVVDTSEWQDLIGAFKEMHNIIERFDWADMIHIWANPAKLPGDEEGTYDKAVLGAEKIKNWHADTVGLGITDVQKNQPWCAPTDDPDVLKVVIEFLTGNEKMMSIIDKAFKKKNGALASNGAFHQINAMVHHEDSIDSYIRERVKNCLGGFPLVKIYADLVNRKVRWNDLPWRNKWKGVDIAWDEEGKEITNEKEFIQNIKKQVFNFMVSQAGKVIDNALQLDLGHGTRRKRERGTAQGQSGQDVNSMMVDAKQGMERMYSLQAAARGAYGKKRVRGQRTIIRDVRLEAIYFAHHLNNMIDLIEKANALKEEAKGDIEKAIQMAAGGEVEAETALEDALNTTMIAQSASVSAEIINQIMSEQPIDVAAAQAAAIEKMSQEDGKQYVIPPEGSIEKEVVDVQQEINEIMATASEKEKAIFKLAMQGMLDQDVLEKIIDQYLEIVEEDIANGDEDAVEKLKMLKILAQMTGVSLDEEPGMSSVQQRQQPASTHAPKILQGYVRNPKSFLEALPKAVQADPSFGSNLLYGLWTGSNPEMNKAFANYFASNPKVWQAVMSSANSNYSTQKAMHALLQIDPSFKQLAGIGNQQSSQNPSKESSLKSWMDKRQR